MDSFLRIYLPLFFIGFILLVFIAPSIRVYRQTGINPFRFATKQNAAHDYIGNSMKLFIILLLLIILIYSLLPSVYHYFAPLQYMLRFELKLAGFILAHISLAGIITAQYQMKQSWRIGIDYQHKTQLVTWGLFSISRNPVYLFLLIGLTGMFLIIPNVVSFTVLFAAWLVLNITMRMEEDFLLKEHGAAYAAYKKKVRRLI